MLCRKCFEKEMNGLKDTDKKDLKVAGQKMKITDDWNQHISDKEIEDWPDVSQAKRSYAIKILNEVFRMFSLEPVVL